LFDSADVELNCRYIYWMHAAPTSGEKGSHHEDAVHQLLQGVESVSVIVGSILAVGLERSVKAPDDARKSEVFAELLVSYPVIVFVLG
jgi:hypothetical protein